MSCWVVNDIEESARRDGEGTAMFALFWSLLTGTASALIIYGAVQQVACTSWPATEGTMTVSEIASRRRVGAVWKLAYEYVVAGRNYTGAQYAYDPMDIQGEQEVLRHVAAYPVGAKIFVYYNPDNAADAVLRPGLRGCTLWVALFLTPFVLIGLGMWAGLARRYKPRPAFDPADPTQVAVTDSGASVVHPQRTRSVAIFLSYLAGTAFAVSWALLFVGFGLGAAYWLFEGFLLDPPVAVPTTVWALILVGCALATRRTLRRAAVLIVDRVGGVVRFASAGVPPVELPLSALGGVFVTQQANGQEKGKRVCYRVELANGTYGPNLVLAEYFNRQDAEALARWLRQQLNEA
ncbi:MAG: DUF3592 domain-containing protein [Gemmataceae bacterium]